MHLLIEDIKNTLSDKEFSILNRRSKGETLQSIASDMHITRERVRQIESRALKKILSLNFKVDKFIILNRNEFLDHNEFNVLLYLFKKKYIVRSIENNIFYVLNISNEEFDLRKITLHKLLLKEGLPISIKELKNKLNNELDKLILNILLAELKAKIENENILYYEKLSKADIVELILRKYRKPMHFKEIADIFSKLSGKNITSHQVESLLLRNKNLYLVDRGTFFLKEEIEKNLTPDIIKALKSFSYKILKDLGKPSDTIFLLEKIKEKVELPKSITPYLLKSILKEDERFVSGRKFEIWLKEFDIDEREDYEHLITNILRESDEPLSINQIQEKLKKIGRDIPYVTINMVFNRSSNIIRVGENLYTLPEKLNLTEEKIKWIKEKVIDIVENYDFPVSLDFISEKLSKEYSDYSFLNRHILYSILKNNGKVKIIPERLVVKAEKFSEFSSYKDIFECILKNNGKPMKINDLLETYKKLTFDFNFKINSLYNYLYVKKAFKVENRYVLLKEWSLENFQEYSFEAKKRFYEKAIDDYLFYKEFSLESFDPEKEKDKINRYKSLELKFSKKEHSEKEKINWLKFLVWSRKPIEISKLLKYIDESKLSEQDKEYIQEIRELFD